MRKSMFTKLDLKRILSRHQCNLRPDNPVFISEIRKPTMANEKEANTLLEIDPADEEAGEDSPRGHEKDISDETMEDLLTLEDEHVSMAVSEPKNQPPLQAKGLTEATLPPGPTEAVQVTTLSAIHADLERVKAEMAKREKLHQEELNKMKSSMRKLEEGKKLADAKIYTLEQVEAERTSRRHKRSWKRQREKCY